MNIDKEEIKKEIIKYLDSQGFKGEIKDKFFDMYKKEMEHIIDMNKKYSKLKPFKRLFIGKEYSKEDFEYKTNDELFVKTINNVNKVISKITRF